MFVFEVGYFTDDASNIQTITVDVPRRDFQSAAIRAGLRLEGVYNHGPFDYSIKSVTLKD